MKNKFFAVITPTYNRAHLLPRCFESLQSQTFKDFAWYIGDDGSTDNTEEVVKELINKSTFPIYYFKFSHRGKHHTVQELLKKVQANYLLSLDSDDEFYNEYSFQNFYDKIQKLPSDIPFWGIAGCFINQYDKIFPVFSEKYIDITKDNFFDFLTKNADKLNIFGVQNLEYINQYQNPVSDDELPYYPEMVGILKTVLMSKDYRYRLFNEPFYRYHQFLSDSVSQKHSDVENYGAVGIANLFYEYHLSDKYRKYLNNIIFQMAKKIKNKKIIFEIQSKFSNPKDRKYFLYCVHFRKYFKYVFNIEQINSKTKFWLLGIKIYTYKRKK